MKGKIDWLDKYAQLPAHRLFQDSGAIVDGRNDWRQLPQCLRLGDLRDAAKCEISMMATIRRHRASISSAIAHMI